jgi:hypothetical protein
MRAHLLGGAWLTLTLLAVAGPAMSSVHHPRFRASSYPSRHHRFSAYGHTRFRASSYPPIPRLPKPRTGRGHMHGSVLSPPPAEPPDTPA